VIDYQTFHQIHHLHKVEHLNQVQIATELQLDEDTVSKWLHIEQYRPCQMPKRPSKLDPFKGTIHSGVAAALNRTAPPEDKLTSAAQFERTKPPANFTSRNSGAERDGLANLE
jgi:hypothetical protein